MGGDHVFIPGALTGGGWGSCLHSRSFDGCVGGCMGGDRVFIPRALMGGWVGMVFSFQELSLVGGWGSCFHSRSSDG